MGTLMNAWIFPIENYLLRVISLWYSIGVTVLLHFGNYFPRYFFFSTQPDYCVVLAWLAVYRRLSHMTMAWPTVYCVGLVAL